MSTEIGRLLRKYGLDFSAHGLRHSHFSILLSEGAPITAVQKRVGGLRLGIYSHAIPSDGKRLALMWEDSRTAVEKSQVVEITQNNIKKIAESAQAANSIGADERT
jgi:hypothetical protein